MQKMLGVKLKINIRCFHRIAAAKSSPWRHDQACQLHLVPSLSSLPNDVNQSENTYDSKELHSSNNNTIKMIQTFKKVLEKSHYNNQNVQKLFGIPSKKDLIREKNLDKLDKQQMLAFAQCPIYLKPVAAGTQTNLPSMLHDLMMKDDCSSNNKDSDDDDDKMASLKCFVSLFLLGFALPRDLLVNHIIGGEDTIALMERLGFLFPCETNPSIMVPYVHLFPLDVEVVGVGDSDNDTEAIVLVTDCHPVILQRTTVGTMEDGAVMYIGPDSLALVHCLPLQSIRRNVDEQGGGDFKVLDFCTGSGIQLISTLVSLKICKPKANGVFVDVNDRALRFAKFNAILNEVEQEQLSFTNSDITLQDSSVELPIERFDMVLANPPFIPVPHSSKDSTINDAIDKRYGLFSSGGSSGEAVLRSIVSLSSKLLKPHGGFLGIVSEFMNPPSKSVGEELIRKIQLWWRGSELSDQPISFGIGKLFTNEYPISAYTYAQRRADNEDELNEWLYHLETFNISCVSPGLLFIETESPKPGDNHDLSLHSMIVPKTKFGSIWTPYNIDAVRFVKGEWDKET